MCQLQFRNRRPLILKYRDNSVLAFSIARSYSYVQIKLSGLGMRESERKLTIARVHFCENLRMYSRVSQFFCKETSLCFPAQALLKYFFKFCCLVWSSFLCVIYLIYRITFLFKIEKTC